MWGQHNVAAHGGGIGGKVIAINGASSGIGAAIAEHLAQRDAAVVLGDGYLRFDELRQDDWDDMVATNLTGVLNGIGAALPVFRAQGMGQFVHISSTSAHRIVPKQGVYAATKTAVRVLSEALRQEAGPNLQVTIVLPGMTNTEGARSGLLDEDTASRVQAMAQPPSAIARAVAFAIEQPAGVDVGEVIVRPTAQS
jgi:NADP-dependent 3-hydroxy acid dehydrogenase YdfG